VAAIVFVNVSSILTNGELHLILDVLNLMVVLLQVGDFHRIKLTLRLTIVESGVSNPNTCLQSF
jgi:hypothetical protein